MERKRAMPPPQFPSSRDKPMPGGDRPLTAGKKPSSFLSPVTKPTKKIARPASAPDVAALSATKLVTASSTPAEKMARPPPQPRVLMAAPSAARPHQHSTPNLAAHSAAARPRPPCTSKVTAPSTPASSPRPSSSKTTASTTHGAKKMASEFMAPRGAESVHPARRLPPGTAVFVRTRFLQLTDKCCLMIWLPARVVSSSDAYHCTVKYAADLNPMFAGKMVRMPVCNIRERAAALAEPRKMARAPDTKDTSLL